MNPMEEKATFLTQEQLADITTGLKELIYQFDNGIEKKENLKIKYFIIEVLYFCIYSLMSI